MTKKLIRFVGHNDRGYRVGQSHHNAKLADVVVDKIRAMREDEGMGVKEIAKTLNLSFWTVRAICRYRNRAQTVSGFHPVKGACKSGEDGED